ncbi:MAG: T9SS type A sorting domain-containing protein [Candidatus Cloacimonadota bacterium]|nr:MAG: T9SS type A sorting domain-containing protein [Candidatus Cloacimonadota bacterium]
MMRLLFILILLEVTSLQEDYATHDCGNCMLTVTRYGAVGYMNPAQIQGVGFHYPIMGLNHLFYGGFAAGTDANYVVDRFDDSDWTTTNSPNGMVVMYEPGPFSDEYATAMYSDSGHPTPKGLITCQYSIAWSDSTAYDFVIMKFVMKNNGVSSINELYAAIFMDWDIGDPYNNQGSSEEARNLTWMYAYGYRYVGVAILDPKRDTPAANLSLINTFEHNVGIDSIKIKFLNGTIQIPSSPYSDDWLTCNSAGPSTLNPGDSAVAAFAIIGGDNLNDLKANADTAYNRYWQVYGIEEENSFSISKSPSLLIYPNPFSEKAVFSVQCPVPSEKTAIELCIYDLSGRLVKSFQLTTNLSALSTAVSWNGEDNSGHQVPGGLYFVRLAVSPVGETPGKSITRKIIKLK